jgi:hypothetical protein
LEISDVRLGVHLTAVKLSDDSFGIAGTLPDIQFHCIKENRDFGDFTPSKIKGQRVIDLLETVHLLIINLKGTIFFLLTIFIFLRHKDKTNSQV